MKRWNRGIALVMAVCISLSTTGCASAGARQGRAGGRSTTITHEQLASANSDNLYDAVVKLRPEWLTSRGTMSATDMTPASVDVYLDASMLGKAEALRDIRLLDVSEVRFFDAGAASARFGMGHPRGVIQVIRK